LAQFNIGLCYAGLKEYEKAVEELDKVVRNYPESEWVDEALERAGSYLGTMGKLPEAIERYKKIVQEYPKSNNASTAQYLLGVAYLEAKNYEQAKAEFREVIKNYPHSVFTERARERLSELAKIKGKVKK